MRGLLVVDVGCGGGRAVAELGEAGAVAVGVDIDEQMVAAARGRWGGGDFRVAGAMELPFEDGSVAGYRADGFVDPVVEVHTAVLTGESALPMIAALVSTAVEPVDGWLAEQRERAARDRMFVAVPMFLVAAHR